MKEGYDDESKENQLNVIKSTQHNAAQREHYFNKDNVEFDDGIIFCTHCFFAYNIHFFTFLYFIYLILLFLLIIN